MDFLKKAWGIASPLIIYGVIQGMVVFVASFVVMTLKMDLNLLYDETHARWLAMEAYRTLTDHMVLITGISGLSTLPVLFWMMRKEWLKRPYIVQQNLPKLKKYIFIGLMAAGLTLAANLLINALELFNYATDYAQIAREMYSEPLYLQILVIGLIMPVVEEVIFRGLILERTRHFGDETLAVFLTSLLFGIYHGNLIQGIYGFGFSLLMIFVYKRSGTFKGPVCFHVISNLSALFLTQMQTLSTMGYSVGIVFFTLMGLFGLYGLKQGNFFEIHMLNLEEGCEHCDDFEENIAQD